MTLAVTGVTGAQITDRGATFVPTCSQAAATEIEKLTRLRLRIFDASPQRAEGTTRPLRFAVAQTTRRRHLLREPGIESTKMPRF